jgi:hypothetical protein
MLYTRAPGKPSVKQRRLVAVYLKKKTN